MEFTSSCTQEAIEFGNVSGGLADEVREDVEDLELRIYLNKKVLRELLFVKFDVTQKSCFIDLLIKLLEENEELENTLRNNNEEHIEAESWALLNGQILNSQQLKREEKIQEFKEKLWEIKYQNERKDRVIKEITENNCGLISDLDIVHKSRNMVIVRPSPYALI